MIASTPRRKREPGFTLIELLVVMAITSILLGLIFGPMVQGFNLTNQARVQVQAQDTARGVSEIVQREMSNAVFIFDNSSTPIWIWARNATNTVVPVIMPYGVIDLVPPARASDQNINVLDKDIDPTTGLAISRGGVALPLAPGRVITRYWLGLRDNRSQAAGNIGVPLKPYTNFYDDTHYQDPTGTGLTQHNPVILYRAVFSPYLPDGRIDTRLFNMARWNNNLAAALHDPDFFYDAAQVQVPAGYGTGALPGWKDLNGDGQVEYFENWAAIARALVPPDRADEVQLLRDDQGKIIYQIQPDPRTAGQNVQVPQMTALARFQPTYVGNDAGSASSISDPNNAMPSVAPSSVVENYGHWSLPYRLYVIRGGSTDFWSYAGQGPVTYNGASTGLDPSTLNPNTLPTGTKPYVDLTALTAGTPQLLLSVDERRGVANFAFPEWIYRHNAEGDSVPPTTEPTPFAYPVSAVNANKLNGVRPLLSLLTMPNGNPSPLFALNPQDAMVIVPGSETVIGPDMRQGPHKGQPITYTRIDRAADPATIGPNEYMINYAGPTTGDASLTKGTIIFDGNTTNQNDIIPETYIDGSGNPQPTFFKVTYQVQNNLVGDIVKVDYLTRQLMTFGLTVRLYDFHSGLPQQVSLTQKIRVRNLQR